MKSMSDTHVGEKSWTAVEKREYIGQFGPWETETKQTNENTQLTKVSPVKKKEDC